MRSLCVELESGSRRSEKTKYEDLFRDIRMWYLQQHKKYAIQLKSEMLSELGKQFGNELEDWNKLAITGYTENSSAKSDLFDRTEQMCKLMLAVYSYGPDRACHAKFNRVGGSWLETQFKFPHLIELLQAQMQAHGEGEKISLAVFTEEKNVRNKLTHQGEVSVCLSAIRCYNVLRDMLVFMEPEYSSSLPRFAYPDKVFCDIQHLMSRLKGFNFGDDYTMLVAGPLHDLPPEALKVLANLRWTLVVDLDGCSSFGGLHSMAHYPTVNDQKLQLATANHFAANKNVITWFTCGDFANYAYRQPVTEDEQKKHLKNEGILFDNKTAFCDSSTSQLKRVMKKCIEILIQKLSSSGKQLNILYIHDFDDSRQLASNILESCEIEFHDAQIPYTMTSVYYDSPDDWDDTLSRIREDYSDSDNPFPVENLFCDLDSMAAGLIEYQRDLPVLEEKVEPFRLPSEEGIMGIGKNLANNLSDVFDVLYEDAGEVSQEQAQNDRDAFFRGGTAAWSVFREEQTITLLPKEEYNRRLSRIKDALKHIPDSDSGASKIFTISHSPGIGGSTLLRQIGWDLHREYPVLLVKRYDNRIKDLVRNLYDKQKLGILLLADNTIDNRERLKEDIRKLDRACALILSVRENGAEVEKKGLIHFTSISFDGENALRSRFKGYSCLSPVQLKEKDTNYNEFVKPDGMRCPFMIGLYYRDKQFSGVTSYVQRMMGQVKEDLECRVLAMLALCSYYGGIGLPQTFVDRYMQIPFGSSYIKKYPHVKAVLLQVRDELCGNTNTYRLRHYLVGEVLLEQCSQRLYGGTFQNNITRLSKLLIDSIFEAYRVKAIEAYQTILEFLFIAKEEDKFSTLILKAPSPSSRKEILLHLAEKFGKLVDQCSPEEAGALYLMTAHFYGHLGRLCHDNSDIGLNNPDDAKKYCEKAVELMEVSSPDFPDSFIYHMLGESMIALFRKKMDVANALFLESPDNFHPPAAYEEYEREVNEIRVVFEKAANYGAEDSANSSLVKLYMQYLEPVYRWKKGSSPVRFSDRQMEYKMEIERLLEWAYTKEMSDKSREIFRSLEDSYRSRFSQDPGSAISYYENRLSTLKGRAGVDAEILGVRRGLIMARLSKHYAEAKENFGKYVTMESTELLAVLEQLEEVLGGQCDPNDYRQRSIRVSCYDRWFYLAKMPGSGRSLEKAIDYSRRWIDLTSKGNDPRPYYYHAVCSTLYVLAGNSIDQTEIASSWKKCMSFDRRSVDRLRDVVMKGTGMEQLLDMRYAGRNPNEYVEDARRALVVLRGSFDRIEADRGYLCIQMPIEWRGKEVKFTLERGNSLSGNQLTHRLETFAGFSYEGFRAMDQYVRDISADEDPPQLRERKSPEKEIQPEKQKGSRTPKEHRTQSSNAYTKNQIFTFVPNRGDLFIIRGKEGSYSGWINGKIEETHARISIENDICRFDTDSIERWGGLEEVVKLLARKESLPCIILKGYGENHYTASLYQTDKTLNDLLSEAPTSHRKTEDIAGQSKTVSAEKIKVIRGKKVSVQIDRIDTKANMVLGSFEYEGESLPIRVPLKPKKVVEAAQKAYKQRKPIDVLITGYADNLYSGKKL